MKFWSQYDVSKYTDEELYNILELNPGATDNELEARIIQQIQRHMYLKTTTGRKLFQFFKDFIIFWKIRVQFKLGFVSWVFFWMNW